MLNKLSYGLNIMFTICIACIAPFVAQTVEGKHWLNCASLTELWIKHHVYILGRNKTGHENSKNLRQ